MKAKNIITAVLLAFIAGSFGYLIYKENRGTAPQTPVVASAPSPAVVEALPTSPESKPEVIVYYFHGNARCMTCRTIEAYAREAVEQAFPADLESGTLAFKTVNIDEPENEHFVSDYELSTRSVVLVNNRPGSEPRWKTLSQVWQLVRQKDEFLSYVQDETRAFLRQSGGA